MNVLRIEKRDDGWWIANVPPGQADSTSDIGYGPYGTRKQAEEDKRGLEQFFREHRDHAPAPDALLPPLPAMMLPAGSTDLGAAETLAGAARLVRRKHLRSAPGQKLLPGFEPE